MQFIQLQYELIEDTNLSSNELRVLLLLMRYQNKDTKQSFPSMQTISEKTGISISTVKKCIKKLSENNYINVSKKFGHSGKHNIYSINSKYTICNNTNTNVININNTLSNKNSKVGFNNFKPRTYDYEDLEKKLLGWD